MSSYNRTYTRRFGSEKGISIIENLVAITLLSFAIISSTGLIKYSMHANQSARSFQGLISEVHLLVEGYRADGLFKLLDKYNKTHMTITNNETVTENLSLPAYNASVRTTYTAIRSASNSSPEAVKVTVVATQRRGALKAKDFTYETIVAQSY
jgi:type II secretory pathway pseudopilin PulG